jgi:hypothetical protein
MKLIKSLIYSSLFLAVVFIAGCNDGPSTSNEPMGTTDQLPKFTLPAGATLVSAELHLFLSDANDQSVNIYRNTEDWDEATVNTVNRPAFDPTVEGNFNAAEIYEGGYVTADILDLVQKWLDCVPNYGLLLDQVDETPLLDAATYASRETANGPFIVVVYSTPAGNQIDTIWAIADAYIWPGTASGNTTYLQTGYVNGLEKQSLIKFDLECTPTGGCTLTPGYWKTHSEFGPAPYDDTWAQLPNGASTLFFLSGKTYYQVLWTPPAGNAYYNLSFHYIAAGLNFMNGADPSAAQAAYDDATTLFNTYTPAQIKALKGSNPVRQQFISLAGILGQYNEGYIGPGHCDE